MDWAQYDLRTIVAEIHEYLKTAELDIPVIAAGGIFTGSDAAWFLEHGAAARAGSHAFHRGARVRPAGQGETGILQGQRGRHRGQHHLADRLPDAHAQGQPRHRRRHTPELRGLRLPARRTGNCAYIEAYNREVALHPKAKKISVKDKTCLCTHMRNFDIWTCGHYTYRLKDTTRKAADGSYQLLSAEHIFHDYQFSTDGKIALPD